MNINKIRRDFPILSRKIHGKPLVYLDNSATSQKPKPVIEAIVDYYQNHNANVHRGVHTLSDEATTAYEKARENVARFIGASNKELIFVRNTTEAINLAAWTWGLDNLKKNDTVLTTEMEHHSNIVPWQQLTKSTGSRLEFIKINKDYELDWQDLEDKLKLKPKLVCIVHASNVLGTINPIDKIVKKAHKAGALVLVDGAQSTPHMPIDVKKLGCDFFGFSGHKMLGPMGIGGLYVKAEVLKSMRPFLTGGGTISEVYKQKTIFAELPDRFDAGTPNVAGAVGLSAAVNYLRAIGMDKIREHEKELTKYALEKLAEINNLTVYGSKEIEKRAGVVAFAMKNIHAHDAAQILDQEGVAVRSGHHCAMILHDKLKIPATARASFYLYNTKEEVDRLVKGVKKVKKVFG